jgi:two-component system, OmpR family, phosphate regulon sensor histidine kinase PhoR
MPLELSFRQLVARLVLIFALSAIVGLLIGQVIWVLFITSLSLLAYQYYFRIKLAQWLWNSKAISLPHADGSWGRIFDGLDRKIKTSRTKQKSLTKHIRRYRDGAEALPDAGIVLGRDLTIQWSNKKAGRLLGIRWPGDSGQRIDNLLREPHFVEFVHKANFDEPCVLESPINSDIRLEMRFMDYGKDQILLLARDISRIHRIEEMRRDFVANVSHELKTPLTVVRGYVEMIQTTEHALDPHWQQAFGVIETQVTRMDRLVEQLLILSRVEVSTDEENRNLLNMPELVKQLIVDAQWLNQDKQHQINLHIDTELNILGIETEIKSACANLISNAIAYTPANGQLDVYWKQNGNKAIFSVKDNGPGIRPEDINRLTERFYRVDKSRSRNTGGSGLGLAIVKHVLHHHNAELSISSQWQQGSEFSIIFEESSV